jgi:hypothetical protein
LINFQPRNENVAFDFPGKKGRASKIGVASAYDEVLQTEKGDDSGGVALNDRKRDGFGWPPSATAAHLFGTLDDDGVNESRFAATRFGDDGARFEFMMQSQYWSLSSETKTMDASL